MKHDRMAFLLMLATVGVAATRLVSAVLRAEGREIPLSLDSQWTLVSMTLATGLAVVEAFGNAFVLWAMRQARGWAVILLVLLLVAADVCYVTMVAPSVASDVRHVAIGALLSSDWQLDLWSIAVVAFNILMATAIGFADRILAEADASGARASLVRPHDPTQPAEPASQIPPDLRPRSLTATGLASPAPQDTQPPTHAPDYASQAAASARHEPEPALPSATDKRPVSTQYRCVCGETAETPQKYAAHTRYCEVYRATQTQGSAES